MFEKFTERARQVVVLAHEEARGLQHNYIGTEHILLGLLREEEGIAAHVLESLEITVERVRAQVVRIVGSSDDVISGQIPFTPRAKKVLELAMRESLSFGHKYVGTEHLLMGLVRENEGVAARILLDFHVNAETVLREVTGRLADPRRNLGREARLAAEGSSGELIDSMWLGGLGGVLNDLATEIHRELERAPDTGDLLVALAAASHTIVARALRELGIDVDELPGVVDRVRAQARAEDELTREIQKLSEAKEQAIATVNRLRAHEHELREQARARTVIDPDVIQDIRRQLGIPSQADEPPQPPEPS